MMYCNIYRYSLLRTQHMFVHFVYSSSRNGCVCERTSKLLVFPEVLLLRKNNGRPTVPGKDQSQDDGSTWDFQSIVFVRYASCNSSHIIMSFCQSQLWWWIADCVFNRLRDYCVLHDITATWGDEVHDATHYVHSYIPRCSKPWSSHRSSHECGGMFGFLGRVDGCRSGIVDCCADGLRFTSAQLHYELFVHLWES